MNFNSGITLTGDLDIKLYDENNNIKDSRFVPNLVVTAGKEYVANKLGYAGSSNMTMNAMSYLAIGTANTASAIGQTALIGEVMRSAITTTTISGTNISYVATFAPITTAYTIQEAGIFNASTSKSITFDGGTGVSSGSINTTHTFSTSDQVRYTNGGGTTVGGLIDSGVYYISGAGTSSVIKLSNSTANAALTTTQTGTYSATGATGGIGSQVFALTAVTNINVGQVITAGTGAVGAVITNVNTTNNQITINPPLTAQAAGTYTFQPWITLTGSAGAAHKLSSGTMLSRTIFPGVNKSTTDTLVISWTITVG
jgi:hypothetical protein